MNVLCALQVSTAVVGITPEVDEFNHYTPFNKPASIAKFLRTFTDTSQSSPCDNSPAFTQPHPTVTYHISP